MLLILLMTHGYTLFCLLTSSLVKHYIHRISQLISDKPANTKPSKLSSCIDITSYFGELLGNL